jgi:hypothetical protein
MTGRLRILGEDVDLPPSTLDHPLARRFVDDIVKHGEMSEPEARHFVETLITVSAEDIAHSWARALAPPLQRLLDTRRRMRETWQGWLEHVSAGRDLPPHLQPDAFGRLFDEMAAGFAELEGLTLRKYVDAMKETELVGDVHSWAESRSGDPIVAESRGRGGEPPGWVERRPPGHAEQTRVERLAYKEQLEEFGENLELRRQVEQMALAFGRDFLPDGWKVHIRRVPRYGPDEAAIQGLTGYDPIFAANGYELVITDAAGRKYNPDGVVQTPDGRGFAFAEWKEPYGDQPSGWYGSLEGRRKLEADLVERAKMSQQIPGCGGWMYNTGVQWMDDLILEIVLEMRASPGSKALGDRIMVPHGRGPR